MNRIPALLIVVALLGAGCSSVPDVGAQKHEPPAWVKQIKPGMSREAVLEIAPADQWCGWFLCGGGIRAEGYDTEEWNISIDYDRPDMAYIPLRPDDKVYRVRFHRHDDPEWQDFYKKMCDWTNKIEQTTEPDSK
jgi:hypothetical protein